LSGSHVCVLVDFIHESFAPLLSVQRSGKIHNQRVVENWYFIIDKDDEISFPNILRTVQYSRILHYILMMKISRKLSQKKNQNTKLLFKNCYLIILFIYFCKVIFNVIEIYLFESFLFSTVFQFMYSLSLSLSLSLSFSIYS